MLFAFTHKMPLTVGKLFTCMCAYYGLTRGSSPPTKRSEENTEMDDPSTSQEQVKEESQYGMQPEVEQAILDVLKVTNPGVEDPNQVPFFDLPDLRQEMDGCRPKTMDMDIDDICRLTTNVVQAKSTANDFFSHNTLEVKRSVSKNDHIWFAIRYLFTLLDKIETLLGIEKKKTTALPKYKLYLQIVLRWSCEVYLKKRSDSDFIKNFTYAISHGNSILKKTDTVSKRTADEAGITTTDYSRVSKLANILVSTDGYVANSGSVTNSRSVAKSGSVANTGLVTHTGLVFDTESDNDDV